MNTDPHVGDPRLRQHIAELERRYDDTLDLSPVIKAVAARRFLVLACVAASTITCAIVAFNIGPIYRATTILISAAAERNSMENSIGASLGQLGGLASLAGINISSNDSQTQEALAVLSSRRFTESFIRDLELKPKLFAADWDSANRSWKAEEPTDGKAASRFDEDVRSVQQDAQTGLISVSIDWRDRHEGASLVNELVGRLNVEMRRRALDSVAASLEFLNKELSATSDIGTREAINRLIEAQIRQRMLANVTAEYAFRVVDPATPPDADDAIWPPKVFLVAMGPVAGLILGCVFALLLNSRSERKSRASPAQDRA